MTMNLSCTQVGALLSFYLNDKLNDQLKMLVREHLNICPQCRAKYETLKKIVNDLQETHKKFNEKIPETITPTSANYTNFQQNLSAYVDNELDSEESLKIKKYAISNTLARKDLENIYALKRLLQDSFNRTKNESKDDFSKFIMNKIDFKEEVERNEFAIFTIASSLIMVTCIGAFVATILFW